jgi:hypothetical protein
VVVRSACGNLDNSASPQLSYVFEVTDVTPTVELNPRGGNEITVTGTGFPKATKDASVTFSDGTICRVTSSSATELVCTTSRFDHGVAGANLDFTVDAYTLTVAVNGLSADTSVTLGVFVP